MNQGIPSGTNGYRRRDVQLVGGAIALAAWIAGCGGAVEATTRRELDQAARRVEQAERPRTDTPAPQGRLNAYVAYALAHNPALRASFERWKSATMEIARARRIPEPVIKYSYFVRSVETRVGPQRHRLSLMQSFPWPTALSAGAEAAADRARAAQRRFDAATLEVRRQVADAYWRLWLVKEEHRLTMEHDIVLETLAGTVRARVRTGDASLADLNQVELGIARHHDHHGAHRETERVAAAELARAIGVSLEGTTLPTTDTPSEGMPGDPDAALREAAREHPRVAAAATMATSSAAEARAAKAARAPSLVAGLDWIAVGDAPTPVPDSGKDAVIVTAGMSLPLWGRSYRDSIRGANAEREAYLADEEAARQSADAALETALSAVRDAQRRIDLYRDTLIPQAETTFRSVLGGYQSGRSTVAAALLSQRDLLELQLVLAGSRAHHARAWAELESVVGRTLTSFEEGEGR